MAQVGFLGESNPINWRKWGTWYRLCGTMSPWRFLASPTTKYVALSFENPSDNAPRSVRVPAKGSLQSGSVTCGTTVGAATSIPLQWRGYKSPCALGKMPTVDHLEGDGWRSEDWMSSANTGIGKRKPTTSTLGNIMPLQCAENVECSQSNFDAGKPCRSWIRAYICPHIATPKMQPISWALIERRWSIINRASILRPISMTRQKWI